MSYRGAADRSAAPPYDTQLLSATVNGRTRLGRRAGRCSREPDHDSSHVVGRARLESGSNERFGGVLPLCCGIGDDIHGLVVGQNVPNSAEKDTWCESTRGIM